MRRVSLIVIACAVSGCATVHQSPGLDRRMVIRYRSANPAYEIIGPGSYSFGLTLDQAVFEIGATSFELDIPIYEPTFSRDGSNVRITSGPFIAHCDLDCECGKEGASGHGSDTATGMLLIELEDRSTDDSYGVAVTVSTEFYRTQSTGGEFGDTSNHYFASLGRIEEAVLSGLMYQEEESLESDGTEGLH